MNGASRRWRKPRFSRLTERSSEEGDRSSLLRSSLSTWSMKGTSSSFSRPKVSGRAIAIGMASSCVTRPIDIGSQGLRSIRRPEIGGKKK